MERLPSSTESAQALDSQQDEFFTQITPWTVNEPVTVFEVAPQCTQAFSNPLRLRHSLASNTRTGSSSHESGIPHCELKANPPVDGDNLGEEPTGRKHGETRPTTPWYAREDMLGIVVPFNHCNCHPKFLTSITTLHNNVSPQYTQCGIVDSLKDLHVITTQIIQCNSRVFPQRI
ncbi:hypothetical protein N7462_010975 [Penicillium macrosclerotiorum]|uniref:uncharacterized protein n=1 Tax=Penicillium macrosclerotiorum TaxID=303699 RepID=UPI002548D7F9|nr:uncharacterized protein N7462_010975 [Penicillium macrosclerotiorum]KAJ5666566.1 hypothetical protein N7462_010975 [Penicillium macrosclerotiorum]